MFFIVKYICGVMKKFIKKYSVQILAFVVTILFLDIIFILSAKIYPFQNPNILISDLYFEYVPFYNYLREAIFNGRGILNSFSFTMGQNMVGILAYYCLSPINLLLLFSNLSNINYFIKIILFIKFGLCALNMSIYLNNKTSKMNNFLFSIAYALMTYNLRYGFNIMWYDVIYMLPLVILGLEKMIEGKSARLYVITLTIMVFTNFYIAFSACIFVAIYFLYYSFIKKKLNIKLFGKFALLSVASVLLNAFMLFPTIFNMLDGKAISAAAGYSRIILYNPIDIIYNITPGPTAGHVLNDLPYFYSSILVLFLFMAFLFNKEVSAREKVATTAVVLFIVFSTLLEPLDLLFHCFKVPNCLYYRYIYILPFFLISVVSRHKEEISWFTVIPLGLLIIWAFAVEFSLKMVIFADLLFMYFLAYKCGFKRVVLLLLFGELFYNSFIDIKIYKGYGFYDQVKEYGEVLKDYYPKENEFYRIEVAKPVTVNDSFILGYYGIDSFSPTITDASRIYLKEYLVFAEQTSMNYIYKNRFILDPYLNGVKYELVNGEVVENENYLPLIVKADNFDYFKPSKDVVGNSNEIYRMINGEYLFNEIDFDIDCIKNNKVVSTTCNLNYERKEGKTYYLSIYVAAGVLFDNVTYNDNTNIFEVDKTFEFDYDNSYIQSVKLYEFDKNSIKNQTNDFEVFRDDYMRLKVDKGLYLMMVPYDESWQIEVNGKKIEKTKVLDSLIGFETDGGTLEIKFIPRGLISGILASGMTLSLLVIYWFRKRSR